MKIEELIDRGDETGQRFRDQNGEAYAFGVTSPRRVICLAATRRKSALRSRRRRNERIIVKIGKFDTERDCFVHKMWS